MEEENDFGVLTEDEEEALKNPPAESDEPEPTAEEPKVETTEPSPPEPGKEGEPKPAGEPEPDKKPDGEPLPPPIDGILTKDGKNVIPFNVLEQERAKRQQLEAELAEFKKPKEPTVTAQPKTEATPQPQAEQGDINSILKDLGIDAKTLAAKAYESQDGMAELVDSLKTAIATGIQIARKTAHEEGEQSATGVLYEAKINQLKAANSWMTPDLEKIATVFAHDEMVKNPPKSIDDYVDAAEKGIAKVKELTSVGRPAFDPKVERDKIREEVTKEVMAKFNIKPSKVTTLSGVRNVNPEVLNKFDQLDQLNGLEYEEAFASLTSQEREAYLRRTTS